MADRRIAGAEASTTPLHDKEQEFLMRYQYAIGSITLAAMTTASIAFGQCSTGSSAQPVALAGMAETRADLIDTAVAAGSFETLAAALKAADLIDVLKGEGPFTVFAPTDEAFAKLPDGTVERLLQPESRDMLVSILTYHVIEGEVPASRVTRLSKAASLNGQRLSIATSDGTVRVAEATVITTDVRASNGIIHIVDSVMMPNTSTIVETAKRAGSFRTLLKAAKEAGLVEALEDEGPMTIFAPTDAAFAKLGSSTIENLLLPENRQQLRAILLSHVVAGRVYADQLADGMRAETFSGNHVTIRMSPNTIRVSGARVVDADIDASNGVIHVIDTVIVPE